MEDFDVDDFVKRLGDPKLRDEGLDEILATAGLPAGRKPGRVFPLGIIVDDGLRVGYDLKPADLGAVLGGLSHPNARGVRSWRIFPIGIVAPESYRLEVDLGRPNG
jgi:hypothetical protein